MFFFSSRSRHTRWVLVTGVQTCALPILRAVEATSFVSPKWVPQLADAAEVYAGIAHRPGVRYPVLVPNERGYDRAREAGADEIAVFTAASERSGGRRVGTESVSTG